MNHQHGHEHNHFSSFKVLAISVLIVAGFAVVEAVSGISAHSLTLLSDAGHMAADAFSLLISAAAAYLSCKPPTEKNTYGWSRLEVISACVSSILLIFIVIFIVIEAISRFNAPKTVSTMPVMFVGFLGLLINIAVAWVLNKGEQNLNTKAAVLHVLSDLLGSVAALFSGIIIYFTGWMIADPILSLLICVLIFIGSINLLKDAFSVLMEAVPDNLDVKDVNNELRKIKYVKSVHNLHVWVLSSKRLILTAHIEIDHMDKWQYVYDCSKKLLFEKFDINYITLQPEIEECFLKSGLQLQ